MKKCSFSVLSNYLSIPECTQVAEGTIFMKSPVLEAYFFPGMIVKKTSGVLLDIAISNLYKNVIYF